MYPASFFRLFPAFPRDWRAFVAMSFDPRFDTRWREVLEPAISGVQVNGRDLEPHRVDLTLAGDSVLTEILEEIGRCRVVIADISALDRLDGRAVRNQNVFYEVGLAHATRLPEEVLLFRSDDFDLAFDISNVRVHRYDPDGNAGEARHIVRETLAGSLRELDVRKHLAVRRAAEGLDYESWMVLAEAQQPAGVSPPTRRTMREALSAGAGLDAITRLLEISAIQAEFVRVTPQWLEERADISAERLVRYKVTPFGSALFDYVIDQIGVNAPELRRRLEQMAAEGGGSAA